MTDPTPEEIDPVIVELYRTNPAIKEFMIMYLAEQVTWRECLEHSLIKLCEQYSGAIAGWKDSLAVVKAKTEEPLKLTGQMVEIPLVDENTIEVTEYQSPDAERLHLALGILGKIVSPGRAASYMEGTSDYFPPIQLGRKILKQIHDLFTKRDISDYVTPVNPCSTCGYVAPLIVNGVTLCAVCDARRGRAEFRLRSDNLIKAANQINDWCATRGIRVPSVLKQSMQEPVDEAVTAP